jgi:fructose-1,6-bisphosphatase/inositol monophosphatase family enzyme
MKDWDSAAFRPIIEEARGDFANTRERQAHQENGNA